MAGLIEKNQSVDKMIEMFENVLDHGTAAHADRLFLELKDNSVSKATRDAVYDKLEQIVVDRDRHTAIILNKNPEKSAPFAQIVYRVWLKKGKYAHPFTQGFGEKFRTLGPEQRSDIDRILSCMNEGSLRHAVSIIDAATGAAPTPEETAKEAAAGNAAEYREIAKNNHAILKQRARRTQIAPRQ